MKYTYLHSSAIMYNILIYESRGAEKYSLLLLYFYRDLNMYITL